MESNNQQIKPLLTKLRLSGMIENLDDRIRCANENKYGYSEFLFTILQDEIERRNNQALALRLRRSNLDKSKTIEVFNFNSEIKIPETVIRELTVCNFIDKAENIIITGQTGTGKSHIATAIGLEACRRGRDTRFDYVNDMLTNLNASRADGSYDRKLKWLIELPLLIIDDFGLKTLSNTEQMDLYEIICKRYEKKSTIITSNCDIKEWFTIFQNALMASAAIDRLLHRGIKLNFEGPSYRFADSIKLNAGYGLTENKK